jgi:hypothetical protein
MVAEIIRQRLHHHQITQTAFRAPSGALAWFGAIQGQDYPGAKWSLGLRVPGCTEAQVEQAIAEGQILRTWLMRGTLHLVTATDLRWMLPLLAPRLIAGNATRYRQLELDDAVFRRTNDLLLTTLSNEGTKTRPELFAMLEAHGIATANQRGIYMLQRASLEGLLCQGVMRAGQPLFMTFDSVVPPAPPLNRADALAELARRYFRSRGPATVDDFAHWAGLPKGDARAGIEALDDGFVSDVIGGVTCWRPHQTVVERVHRYDLLPGFDEYLLGYRDRSAVLEPQYAERICPGGNGVFYPTLLVNGRVVATWKRAIKRSAVRLTLEPFEPLEVDANLLEGAVARYGAYVELPAQMEML